MQTRTLCAILASGLFVHSALGHSWNEQFSLIDQSTGDYTGAYGYPRGYVERTDPGFNDGMMTYLIPEASTGRTRPTESDLLCHPGQRTQNQTSGFPRLQVAPGSVVAMKYLENGHVTLPQNQPGKPPDSGTVFVFGTTQPSDSEKLVDVMQWTADGTGGDGRGRLLTAQNFDDGRCHQINSGPISQLRLHEFPDPPEGITGYLTENTEQWCETDLVMPSSAEELQPGKPYTVYWIWQWPTEPLQAGLPDGKNEYYSTCSDFDVVEQEQNVPPTSSLVQQDPQTHAVSDFMSRTAITPLPNIGFFMATSWPATTWASVAVPTAVLEAQMAKYPVSGVNGLASASPALTSTVTATLSSASPAMPPSSSMSVSASMSSSAAPGSVFMSTPATATPSPPYPTSSNSSAAGMQPTAGSSGSSSSSTSMTTGAVQTTSLQQNQFRGSMRFTAVIQGVPGHVITLIEGTSTTWLTIPTASVGVATPPPAPSTSLSTSMAASSTVPTSSSASASTSPSASSSASAAAAAADFASVPMPSLSLMSSSTSTSTSASTSASTSTSTSACPTLSSSSSYSRRAVRPAPPRGNISLGPPLMARAEGRDASPRLGRGFFELW